jgi:NhaP-type Na+/H+ or K+/H+ antiporter
MILNLNLILILVLGGGYIFSKIFSKMKLPAVIGMVVFGILCSLFLTEFTPALLWDIAPYLKSFALIVILLRAGLGIRRSVLQRVGITALLISFVPCVFEGFALMVLTRYLLNFSWPVAGMTGFMLAAVSPAVIVPAMLDLIKREKSDVPTIVLAGASIDDVIAITLFYAFLGLAGSENVDLARSFVTVPVSIILGIAAGLILGLLLSLLFKYKKSMIRATEKMLIILVCAIFLFQIGDILHFAALLGIMTVGFILLEKNEEIAHELAAKLAKLWIFAEIILFVLIGFSLDITVAIEVGFKGILIIALGLVFRSIGVLVATFPSKLNWREKLFCIIAYLPKATVQAALGGVALEHAMPEGTVILALAVLAILFTAPLGLLGINLFGTRLLATGDQPGK